MPRGGRSSGGGGRSRSSSYSKAPPPAAAAPRAPAPAPSGGGGGSGLGSLGSEVVNASIWAATWSTVHRAMDTILGPRTFQIEHTTATAAAAGTPVPAAAASSPSASACDIHALALQDCINGSEDVRRCHFYIDLINECRRRGQTAVVETHG